jgi:hypothetical protein
MPLGNTEVNAIAYAQSKWTHLTQAPEDEYNFDTFNGRIHSSIEPTWGGGND